VEETLAGLNSLTSKTPPASAANITFSAMAEVQTRCSETQAARMSASLHVVDRCLISHRFLWSWMRIDIANWCRDCQACQMSKTTRQSAAAVQPIPVPSRRYSHMHMDLVSPLPTSTEEWSYITMMDRSTR
jgi:hypothetical protein